MRYLEEKYIVHRDLSLRNVLVTKDPQGKYVAKISDFGLSRFTEKDYYRTDDKTMPVKWTSIEAIEFGIYTSKSDVWSFGICLWYQQFNDFY
jgi:serine/threonine protein kinase